MDKSAELRTVLPILGNLTNDELQEIANAVARIVLDRKSRRKKELWDNICKAIEQFEDEIGGISIEDPYDGTISLLKANLSSPGVIVPYYD